jgi:hypothetical protein
MKYGVVSLAAAFALCAGPAFALQNVANTSQKGSLLIFPLVTVDPTNGSDTLIEITNDATSPVRVYCTYVNEKKGRVHFDFDLTGKATASWDVNTLAGDGVAPAAFPVTGNFNVSGNPAGNGYSGELNCFAVDAGDNNQISFNNLSGTATVLALADTDGRQTRQAFRYSAWAFIARGTGGLPAANNIIMGTPGTLALTGANDGKSYDACPWYNVATIMPNGAPLGNLTTLDNDLSVVSCNQDLRQDWTPFLTKLQFTVWNSHENSFEGSYQCADSVQTVPLSAADNANLVVPSNFDYSVLQTPNARFQVMGVSSTQCPGSAVAGLLGVVSSSVSVGAPGLEDQEVASNTVGAGSISGFVLWDPAGTTPFTPKK